MTFFNLTVTFSNSPDYNLGIWAEDKEEATLRLITHIIQHEIWTTQILKRIIIEEK